MGTKFKLPMPSREDIFYASVNLRCSDVEVLLRLSSDRPIGLFWDYEDQVTREPMCPVVGFLTGVGVNKAESEDAKIYAYDPSSGSSTYYKYCALLRREHFKCFEVMYRDDSYALNTGYIVGSPVMDASREFTSLEVEAHTRDYSTTVALENIAYINDIKTGIEITEDTIQNG